MATAAPTASNAHNHALMAAVNVDGTRNVINACVRGGVPRLVLTSSASVVFSGRDLIDVTEAEPYAARPMDYYTHTKIEGGWVVVPAAGAAHVGAAHMFSSLLPTLRSLASSKPAQSAAAPRRASAC